MDQNDTKGQSLCLIDAHCHAGWFADPVAVAREAAGAGVGFLAVTVTPEEYLACREKLAGEKNVALAAGLHPWWVHEASDADALCELLPQTRWVGEVGLDASPRHAVTWEAQLAVFERICETCAETSPSETPKVVSIHAVRSAGAALDILERTGAAERCRCVFHWFSGTSEELWRAMRLGCLVSLGERGLGTRRGREYARVVPEGRLLVETDLPDAVGSSMGVTGVLSSLKRAITAVASARGIAEKDARELLVANGAALAVPLASGLFGMVGDNAKQT